MLQNLAFWLALRLITSLWAALVSPFRPLNPVEVALPLWPPVFSTAWLDRVLLAPWVRWDAYWYLRIVSSGYQNNDGTLQFHPLFPWLAQLLYAIGFYPILALQIVSTIASLALLIAFQQLARQDLNQEDSYLSGLLFSFFPVSFILFAPYPESLFILFSVLSFLFARRKRWWLAGISGMLASLTRQQGLFLVIPLIWEIWQAYECDWKQALHRWTAWSAPILTISGYLIWILYRLIYFSEMDTIHSGINVWIYSLLVSPSANQVVPQQAFLFPWQALILALQQTITKPDLDMIFNLFFASAFLSLFIISWKGMRSSYRLYSLTIILVSLSYYTGTVHPYMGLPRHLLLAFPVFIGLAPRLRQPILRLAYIGLSLIGTLVLLTGYILEAWVP